MQFNLREWELYLRTHDVWGRKVGWEQMITYVGKCTTCDARITFVPTVRGREMPCEYESLKSLDDVQAHLRYAVKRAGLGCEIKSGADVLADIEPGDVTTGEVRIYVPHWGNCNAPDHHRRRKR